MVCPSGAWFENRSHLTPFIHLAWNPKHVIVQWVGIGTHTLSHHRCFITQGSRFNTSRSYPVLLMKAMLRFMEHKVPKSQFSLCNNWVSSIDWYYFKSHHNHQCVLPKGRYYTTNSWTKVAVLLGMNRCGSFSLLSAPHSLFSIWTDLKRSGKNPGAPTSRWGKWIWLTGPSGLYRNSPQGLNISSIRVFTRSDIQKSQSPFAPKVKKIPVFSVCNNWFHLGYNWN